MNAHVDIWMNKPALFYTNYLTHSVNVRPDHNFVGVQHGG